MGEGSEEIKRKHHLAGLWTLHSSENYDEFLEQIGVNVVGRQIATRAKPTLDIDQLDEGFTIRTITGPFTPDEVFTVGVETLIIEPDGRKIKLTPEWSDKGLVVQYVPISGRSKTPYTITRIPTLDDRLIVTLQSGDVVSKRVFKKQFPEPLDQ